MSDNLNQNSTMNSNIRVMIDEDTIKKRISEIADLINTEFAGEEITLACVLKGSVFITCDLAKLITVPLKLDFITLSSYGSETTSSGVVKMIKDFDEDVEEKNIIVIEDIVDSGRTLSYLMKLIKERNPKKLKLFALLDKPDRRVVDVDVDYIGFTIPDEFVVGYGLDYDQKYRNLSYIGVVETN